MAGNLVEVRSEILFLGPTACHYAGQWIIQLFSENQQVTSFVQHERFIHVCFQMYRLHYVESLRGLKVVRHAESPIQARDGLEPRVTKKVRIPQMLVRIDDLHGCCCFPRDGSRL